MDLQLNGRRAVVTGGSRGIGLAVARALAAEGADVALVARNRDALQSAAEKIAADSGRRVIAVPADTGDDASVAEMARSVVEQLGGADILVNAAARPNTGIPETDFETELNVKVRGYLRTARAFAPLMREQGWGRIINIGGIAARQTSSLVGSVRNVAVAAMTKNLADELGPHGVNVVVLHPGPTRTETSERHIRALADDRGISTDEAERLAASMVSIGRMVTAEEVADVVAFLASPRSVALNGDPVVPSGGMRGPIHY
ncbi:SDR family NAD(P)-dependent oxidoreductase [Streptomyces sp. 3214.6]|uniref:SDR family NAD(P)-dependent oxidoreductase n=1 Tax=Streptomyces sp. 3214.6 TaxID=1882757 RepID=UPI0009096A51|nr:SDR family oxidoreductase [Streptomyces sp. 3214.6]SHH30958.1 Short-chain dehydrogenase [Streptomyces sp. 3214.6]